MPVSYSVSKTLTTFTVNYRITEPSPGLYDFNQRRGFIPFDLSTSGLSAGQVESAVLILRCTAVVGGGADFRLTSAVDPDGFSTTLDASNADWASSDTHIEDVVSVNSTGTYTWNVDPAHLSFTGRTYFRLMNEDEFAGPLAPYQTNAAFNSSEAGTPANRPILRLTLASGQVIFINANGGLM